MKNIKIFDTTLRDGEQSPGCSMSIEDKVKIAKILDDMKVDVIEAGFAASNKKDFESIEQIIYKVDRYIISHEEFNQGIKEYIFETVSLFLYLPIINGQK